MSLCLYLSKGTAADGLSFVNCFLSNFCRKSSGPEPDEVVLPLDKQLVIKQKLYWLFEWLHVPTPSSADSTQATNSSPTKPDSNPASNLKTSPAEKVRNGDQNINKYTSSSPALKTSQLPTSASSCQKSDLRQDTAVKHLSLSSDDSQASTSASSTPVKPTSKRSLTEDEEDERNDHKLNPNTKRVKIESCKEGVSDMVTPHSTTVRSSYEISNGPDRTGTVESISVDDSHSAAVVSNVTATESNRYVCHVDLVKHMCFVLSSSVDSNLSVVFCGPMFK